MCHEKKLKSVLYEVSLYLAENSHDYEARELHGKVISLMDNEGFEEGRAEHEAAGLEKVVTKICTKTV
jgi:hypothetical protein